VTTTHHRIAGNTETRHLLREAQPENHIVVHTEHELGRERKALLYDEAVCFDGMDALGGIERQHDVGAASDDDAQLMNDDSWRMDGDELVTEVGPLPEAMYPVGKRGTPCINRGITHASFQGQQQG
jgi:hypothetical protein